MLLLCSCWWCMLGVESMETNWCASCRIPFTLMLAWVWWCSSRYQPSPSQEAPRKPPSLSTNPPAQRAFVSPARRITSGPLPNKTLDIIIVASVTLQILTITDPGLRTMLGLVPLNGSVLALVAAALIITVVGTEIWSRRMVRRGDT